MPHPIPDQKKDYDKTAEKFETQIFFGRANRNHRKNIKNL
jgi:hypothetical protein